MSQNPPQGSEGEGQGRLPCPFGDALNFFPKITESIAVPPLYMWQGSGQGFSLKETELSPP